MADYTSWSTVKSYLAISGVTDDTLGATLVTRASAIIDRFCRRQFAAATATRTFDVPAGETLWLDEDLLSVTALTNGDGVAVASSQYVLLPANATPKFAIRLRRTASVDWVGSSATGDEQAISVQGSWGYSTTPPDDVVQAAIRLTAWLYKQRDAPFGTTARPDVGIVEVPAALPEDVKALLLRYQKARVTAV
jgi:hypothetical protein